jgi:hypothetical protein
MLRDQIRSGQKARSNVDVLSEKVKADGTRYPDRKQSGPGSGRTVKRHVTKHGTGLSSQRSRDPATDCMGRSRREDTGGVHRFGILDGGRKCA